MSDDKHPFTVAQLDSAIQEEYAELLDVNQKIIDKSRRQAGRLEDIQHLHLEQAQRCQELIEMHIEMARVIATSIGDVLATEWDITDDDDTEDTEAEEEEADPDVDG